MWLALLLLVASCLAGCERGAPGPQLSPEQQAQIDAAQVEQPPATLIGIEARFGDAIALVGYQLDPPDLTQKAGSTMQLTLVWRCDRRPPPGYRFFTHLADRRGRVLQNLDEAGPLRAMPGVDGPPLPPWRCKPGRYLRDTLTVPIPTTAPNRVQLLVGLYQGEQRLAASGGGTLGQRDAAMIKLRVDGGKPVEAAASPVPQMLVTKLPSGEAPTIDGVLDEPLWNSTARTSAFVHAGNGRPLNAPPRGHARLSYDDEHLYVAFEVQDHTLRGGFAPDAIDPQLWTRDTVEIMIDPDGDGDNRDYYEIQINPQNLIFDSHFDAYNQPRGGPRGPFGHQDWSASAKSAVTLRGSLDDDSDRDQGYVVEAAIPWRAFHKAKHAPPRPGDQWRMNFYAMQNNGGAAWSPILGQGNFHRASRFGRVLFR